MPGGLDPRHVLARTVLLDCSTHWRSARRGNRRWRAGRLHAHQGHRPLRFPSSGGQAARTREGSVPRDTRSRCSLIDESA